MKKIKILLFATVIFASGAFFKLFCEKVEYWTNPKEDDLGAAAVDSTYKYVEYYDWDKFEKVCLEVQPEDSPANIQAEMERESGAKYRLKFLANNGDKTSINMYCTNLRNGKGVAITYHKTIDSCLGIK